jgi:hypothetical protein
MQGGAEGEESCREEQREGSHARRRRKEKGVVQGGEKVRESLLRGEKRKMSHAERGIRGKESCRRGCKERQDMQGERA